MDIFHNQFMNEGNTIFSNVVRYDLYMTSIIEQFKAI